MRIAVLILLLAATPVHAGRLFQRFDFEERPRGNVEDVPMHWAKVAGPGLPHYVGGHFVTDVSRTWRTSFRMDLDGGSCAYQYDVGRLPVTLHGRYRVSGFARTTPLPHARARLTVAAVDGAGRAVAEAKSDPYAGDDWHLLAAEVTVDDPRAVGLRVRMELDQPARLGAVAPPAGGVTPIVAEDIRGSAWFDDLTVAQQPRLTVTTGRPCNVFRLGDRPAVSVRVDDPSPDDLAAQVVVTDVAGRAVWQQTQTVTPGAGVSVALPVVTAGWYRATVRVALPTDTGDGNDAATASVGYVQLADDGRVGPADGRFAVASAGGPWPAVLDVLPMLSVGRAKVDMTAADVDAVLSGLMVREIRPIGCLPSADVGAIVGRHAGHVDRWQVGVDGDPFAVDPAVDRKLAATGSALTGGAFDLAVLVPMGADSAGGGAVSVWVPATLSAGDIGPYLAGRTGGPRVASVSLEALPAGHVDRAGELVKRIVLSLAAGVERVDVPVPVVVGDGGAEATDLFPVERTLLGALSGATCRGRVPLADGVEAVLFERPGGEGVAVIWSADGVERPVEVRLGDRLTATDLVGHTAAVAGVSAGPVPVLVGDVDVPLARFRAGLALDRPTIESLVLRTQVRRLHLTNPYANAISGVVRLRGPAGWTLSPVVVPFELAPGASVDRDVGINLRVNARAGVNKLVADVRLDVGGPAAVRVSVPLAVTVGLADVGVEQTAVREAGGVVVQQKITNYGSRAVDYVAYAAVPGKPRVERLVTRLAAGGVTVKRYTFAGVDGPVTVKAGVRSADGQRVLNELLTVP